MRKKLSSSILGLLLCCIVDASSQTKVVFECMTPNDKAGQCIPLRNCTSLFNQILKGSQLTPDDRSYLSRSQCGNDDSQPLVCCPDFIPATESQYKSHIQYDGSCGSDSRDHYLYRDNSTQLGDYPWLVLLEYIKPNYKKEIQCVGILINKRYVLTAAHCLHGNQDSEAWNITEVRLGEYDLLTDPDCLVTNFGPDCAPSAINIPISETIIHENYDPLSKKRVNDIALLRLDVEVELADFVKSICLPFQNNSFNYEDHVLTDIGWNRETIEHSKQIMDRIKIINNTQCNDLYYNSIGVIIDDTQICGLPQYETYTSCHGLPGRSLVRQSKHNFFGWYLVGIESFGSPICRQEGWPIVYTRISSYADWIKSKMYV